MVSKKCTLYPVFEIVVILRRFHGSCWHRELCCTWSKVQSSNCIWWWRSESKHVGCWQDKLYIGISYFHLFLCCVCSWKLWLSDCYHCVDYIQLNHIMQVIQILIFFGNTFSFVPIAPIRFTLTGLIFISAHWLLLHTKWEFGYAV
jgi:hypothetical protein